MISQLAFNSILNLKSLLLADLSTMSRDFHAVYDKPFDNPIAYVIMGGALAISGIAYYFWSKKDSKIQAKSYHDVPGLFKDLSHVHGLSKLEMMAVKELAEARGINPATNIFLHEKEWAITGDEASLQNYRTLLMNVKKRVFAP
jgi:hypothetical protein